MSDRKTDIWVYAAWQGLPTPTLLGKLSAAPGKDGQALRFCYHNDWLLTHPRLPLDPDLTAFEGWQFPGVKESFGMIGDAMPDSWGRKLLKQPYTKKIQTEAEVLLAVSDLTRMGGLRFKTNPDGEFLSPASTPKTSVRDLQAYAHDFEKGHIGNNKLYLLQTAGCSLGGGRPKANIADVDGQLWIAKFPSAGDTTDKAAWEYLAYRLAVQSGIGMSECKLEHVHGKYRTFFTKRFDRNLNERIHFSSAMTMTGYHEALIRDASPSYLEIAEFMQKNVGRPGIDLPQLWRRIVFNIAISNTDDHLRNHGFLLKDDTWVLSPAYDLNPSVDKTELGLNIDMDSNELDFELARSVGEYFELSPPEMEMIIGEVQDGISNWRKLATDLNIPRSEQEVMAPAFRPGQQSKREQRINR